MTDTHITDAEAVLLEVLWRRGRLGAADLIDEVRKKQGWGEATIKTLLGRLMRKGVISTERVDKRQRYRPAVNRETYLDAECQALADRLFDGDVDALIQHLQSRITRP